MKLYTLFTTIALASQISASPLVKQTDGKQVSDSQYAALVRNAKFAAAALAMGCKSIYGAAVVSDVSNAASDTQGYVARDDTTKEIIVALRGTSSLVDALTDGATMLVNCVGTNIPYPSGALCHQGFMTSYNSVAAQIIGLVQGQVASYPGYSITVTGHSLSGALASFAALSMKYNFPSTPMVAYSYGQPRNGNRVYANFHDSSFPTSNGLPTFSRGVHTDDGVPQVVRQGSDGDIAQTGAGLILPLNNPKATSGYWHHGTEIWQFQEPATAADTVQCVGQEDATCQDSLYIFAPILGINAAHLTYFGQPMTSILCPAA